MKKSEIKVDGIYIAKVSGKLAKVLVEAIRETDAHRNGQRYDVTNLATGRKTTFRSAAKFRSEVKSVVVTNGILVGDSTITSSEVRPNVRSDGLVDVTVQPKPTEREQRYQEYLKTATNQPMSFAEWKRRLDYRFEGGSVMPASDPCNWGDQYRGRE